MEEKLKAEILFLKEQIQAEQCLKENLEETLQLEIENCKEEIGEGVWNWGQSHRLRGCTQGVRGQGSWQTEQGVGRHAVWARVV